MADAPKILVIEGDEALAEDLIARLEHKGFKPQLAKNRSQASALLRCLRFDAVLSDVRLPDGIGISYDEEYAGRTHSRFCDRRRSSSPAPPATSIKPSDWLRQGLPITCRSPMTSPHWLNGYKEWSPSDPYKPGRRGPNRRRPHRRCATWASSLSDWPRPTSAP